jgi:hypothetical protein
VFYGGGGKGGRLVIRAIVRSVPSKTSLHTTHHTPHTATTKPQTPHNTTTPFHHHHHKTTHHATMQHNTKTGAVGVRLPVRDGGVPAAQAREGRLDLGQLLAACCCCCCCFCNGGGMDACLTTCCGFEGVCGGVGMARVCICVVDFIWGVVAGEMKNRGKEDRVEGKCVP